MLQLSPPCFSSDKVAGSMDNSDIVYYNLIKNSQAVKKGAAPKKGHGEKRCEIQGGGQEMAVMVG